MMKDIFIIIIVVLLSACAKPFQPVAPEYKRWTKHGATELDIKKSLLECGVPSVNPTVKVYEFAFDLKKDEEQLNKFFLENACMEKSGYIDRWGSVKESCQMYPERKYYPACQPNAKIPTPSVERRLNSWYCKIKTDYQYCLEHAVNPSACNPEGYKNPPPECLP